MSGNAVPWKSSSSQNEACSLFTSTRTMLIRVPSEMKWSPMKNKCSTKGQKNSTMKFDHLMMVVSHLTRIKEQQGILHSRHASYTVLQFDRWQI